MATRNEWSARKGRSSSWLYKPTRHAIYHRDGHACVYCHKESVGAVRAMLDTELADHAVVIESIALAQEVS